ncbi:glycosyltransferase [Nocardioides koreensis]|uniref:Glucosyl-3-phosphoglycerate synthase n=1 Tax=Nocardioides koreensis TaxID=433651 RepID=A0ABN2Z7C7_9ACTN
MTTVTAVIRAYNEGAHLGRLLHGLRHQTRPVDEIVVVDSGSSDDTVQIAEDHGCRVVNIAKEDFTFGRSLNYGCEAAKGELLLIVSAHVYPVYDTYVQHMVAPFDESETAIAYGRQIGDERTKFSESRIMMKWFPEESIHSQGHPFSNNANAIIRKDIWSRLRYDERLTGLEDLDLAKRALELGLRMDYVAEAPVVHVHEETWSTIRNRYRREAIAYKKIMREEQFTAPEAIVLAGANIASDYWHAWRHGQLLTNLSEIPKFRVAQFLGAVEGFRTSPTVSQSLLRRFYYPTDMARPALREVAGQQIEYDV